MKKAIIITICGAAIIWTIADFVLALPVKADEEAKEMDDPFDFNEFQTSEKGE